LLYDLAVAPASLQTHRQSDINKQKKTDTFTQRDRQTNRQKAYQRHIYFIYLFHSALTLTTPATQIKTTKCQSRIERLQKEH